MAPVVAEPGAILTGAPGALPPLARPARDHRAGNRFLQEDGPRRSAPRSPTGSRNDGGRTQDLSGEVPIRTPALRHVRSVPMISTTVARHKCGLSTLGAAVGV